MDRLINYVFLFILIYLFVLNAGLDERFRIGIGLVVAILFSLTAFFLNWLTLDGAKAASVFGVVVLGIGGWYMAIIILVFFLSSTLISRNSIVVIQETLKAYSEKKRRDGIQVWSNGFWIAVFVILGSIYSMDIFLLGAVGAIAAATADTWATELGSRRFDEETYLITNFHKVASGTDGGISFPGTVAAIGGSLLIAGAASLLFSLPWVSSGLTIFAAGFLGCVADSYFGATFQQDNHIVSFGSEDSPLSFKLDNNFVNWAATGFGSLVAVTINLLFL